MKKNKYIKITECKKCPYIYLTNNLNYVGHCKKYNISVPYGINFPDWCNLSDTIKHNKCINT